MNYLKASPSKPINLTVQIAVGKKKKKKEKKRQPIPKGRRPSLATEFPESQGPLEKEGQGWGNVTPRAAAPTL